MSEASPSIGDEQSHDNEEQPATAKIPSAASVADAEVSAQGGNEPLPEPLPTTSDDEDGESVEELEEDEEEDEDDEPKLKYARLTQHMGPVYRNGDATSCFLVAGDKMIVGTHNGNIHVIQLPMFQTLRVYHVHSASVTSVSISPFPPPLSTTLKPDQIAKVVAQSTGSPMRPGSQHSNTSTPATARKPKEPPPIPNIPSNNIYIATSSMDGNVCVQSLVDIKDVHLRSFGRPVQAVALSPDYKTDRTYISGGLAGSLVLTVGGQQGRSTSTTTGTAAAVASGWLGTIGLGNNTGKDKTLHNGEGTINTIKWSMSGKYVVWLNEFGIKIMRSKLHLDSVDAEDAWQRIAHIDRPEGEEWDTMASVWKGRAEWIDEQTLDGDDDEEPEHVAASPAAEKLKQQQLKNSKKIERLIVGWGSTIWIINVHPGGIGVGKNVGEKSIGRVDLIKKLRMDCIISGISLYTQNLLLVLAYCLPDKEDDEDDEDQKTPTRKHKSNPSTTSSSSEPSGGRRRRQNNQPPELRLIDLVTQAEVDKDGLSVSRFERLSAGDYHMGILPAQTAAAAVSSKGALEAIAGFSTDVWNAAINPKLLFSSSTSVKSKDSNDGGSSSKVGSTAGSLKIHAKSTPQTVHPNLAAPGVKIFIHSPYDCILATRRDRSDHLAWLLEHKGYEKAWELVDEHPEIANAPEKLQIPDFPPSTPDKSHATHSSDDFYEDSPLDASSRVFNSSAEREKRRIGELWIKQLVDAGNWTRAGQVAGKVLGSSDSWKKCVYTFAAAGKFDEITNYIPTDVMQPPIPPTVYEVILEHYLQADKLRFRELLDRWPSYLFNVNEIATILEKQLKYRDVREDSVEDGEKGRDWRIVMESLAKLHEANGRDREALKCYIKLQDADSTFRLIRDSHLAEAVTDDIPSFITLRVPAGREDDMNLTELEEATSEAVILLVDEAQHGLVKPEVVVSQLQKQNLSLYTFFYLRGLWKGDGIQEHMGENRDRLLLESKILLDDFADLTVHLFATYDRTLLMSFLKFSTSYSFEKAEQECKENRYVDELVYLYSKTGQMKKALYLIIDRLGDVSQAISFAKEQDDPDLWEDLLNYSMDKPQFIRGLLEEVGTSIDPITLVQRIPEGLEIPGLREGLTHIMKEHEIQYSISSGVARVLRSEVAAAQATLRSGQRKGIKFEVEVESVDHVDVKSTDVATLPVQQDGPPGGDAPAAPNGHAKGPKEWRPGHCARCYEPFTEWETDTLVGFTCAHVFHLAHLLELLGVSGDVAFGMDSEARTRRNTIGMKVTHARLLKDRIRGGCPVCIKEVDGGA